MQAEINTSFNNFIKPFVKGHVESWLPQNMQTSILFPQFAGRSKYLKNYWIRHNNYINIDIEIIVDGNLKIIYEGESYLLNAGEMAFIPSGNYCLETGPLGFCNKIYLGITGSITKNIMDSFNMNEFFKVSNFYNEDIKLLHQEIFDLLATRNHDNINNLSALAYKFLMQIANYRESIKLPKEIIEVKRIMEKNISDTITLKELCSAVYCSKSKLTALFKKHLNSSVMQYLIDLRIDYAKKLLSQNNIRIKDVASQCGFKSQLYFTNNFHKHTGMSPTQYVKKNNKLRQ